MNDIIVRRYDEENHDFLDLEKVLGILRFSLCSKKTAPFYDIEFKRQELRIRWPTQKFYEPTSSQIDEKKSDLLKAIDTLQSYFDDPTERHIQYFRFKEELKRMREIIDVKHWDLLRLVIGCIDATTNTPAADLDPSKVKAFRKVVEQVRANIDCSAANSLLEILISVGLKPVPDLQDLEPMEI
jgi:hypothetical protein